MSPSAKTKWIALLLTLIVAAVVVSVSTSSGAAKRTMMNILQDKAKANEIASARNLSGGWEPTYLCVLHFASTQRAAEFLDELGLNEVRDLTDRRLDLARVESEAASEFQALAKGNTVSVFVGIYGPYHTKAFLNETNIILLLDRL